METSSVKTPFPGWISIPRCSVFLFIFYILFCLLSKMMGCFSGFPVSSASDEKLFCGVFSAFKCSFDEFVGEKVISPSYSSTILAPPLNKWHLSTSSLLLDLSDAYISDIPLASRGSKFSLQVRPLCKKLRHQAVLSAVKES